MFIDSFYPERTQNPGVGTGLLIAAAVVGAGFVGYKVLTKAKKTATPKPTPAPSPSPQTCPQGQVWSDTQGECIPLVERPKHKVGDVVAQGTWGHVGWRVRWVWDPENPDQSDPRAGPNPNNIYCYELIDSQSQWEMDRKWFEWGSCFYELEHATDEAKKTAADRPWAP